MSRHAVERLLLRLLQRRPRALLRRRLCLCLRKRDDRLGADGPGRRGALDAHRRRARHARGHRRGQRRGDGDGLGALVAGHVREHAVERLFGRRRAWARALEPDRFGGRQHAGAQVCGAGRAGHNSRRDVGGGDLARFEGRAVGGAVAVAVTVGVRGAAWGRVGHGRRGGCGGRCGCGACGGRALGGGQRGREGSEGIGGQGVSVGGKVVGEGRGGERGRGDEEGRDLYFGRLDVGRAYDRVLLLVDAVERAERVGRELAGNLRIGVSDDRVPYFDGTAAFEDIYPYRAPANKQTRSKGGRRVFGQKNVALSLLGKGARVVAKEFEKSVGVSFHVELHLSLLQNLQRGRS